MQGDSLVPLLKGQDPKNWRDAIYYHYYEFPSVHMVARHYGVRDSRYKLIHFYQFDEWEFYDLHNDPDELANEYSSQKYAAEISRLKKRLGELRKQYQDESDVSVKSEEWQRDMFDRIQSRKTD